MNIEVVREIGNWLLFGVTGLFLVFIVLYHVWAPWWKTPQGRHMMTMAVTAFLALALSDLAVLGVEYPGRGYARIVVLGLLLVVGVGQIRLLWRAQRAHRGEKSASPLI